MKHKKISVMLLIIPCLIAMFGLCVRSEDKAENNISFYVSPNGDDSADGSLSSPFKTLQRARDKVREINKSMNSDINIILRGGVHLLDETLLLDSRDSGENGYNIIYTNYKDEDAVISGGRKIEGWTLYDKKKNIWVASCEDINSRQLFVNGKRAVRARSEDGEVPQMTRTQTGYIMNTSHPIETWGNVSDIEFYYKKEWCVPSIGIQSIKGKEITMKSGFNAIFNIQPTWIENAFELLNREQEWYLDRISGVLYYIPTDGEDMENADVIIPVLEQLISADGEEDQYIHNVVFKGLKFEYATWLGPSSDYGFAHAQAGFANTFRDPTKNQIIANVNFSYASNIQFIRNTFSKLGSAALWFDIGCADNLVEGNEFFDISSSAVMVGMPSEHIPRNEQSKLKRNVIKNNYIHEVGLENQGSVGIFAAYTQETEIAHNEIFNLPYSGISNGWGWRDYWDLDTCQNNNIHNNLIYNVMEYLRDGGGIYNLGTQNGLQITDNVVFNVNTTFGCAYYLDDGSRYITLKNNIGYNTPAALYSKGGDHIITDNYFDSSYLNTNLIGDQQKGHGADSVIKNTVVKDGYFPISIIANAGLEYEFQNIKSEKGVNILKNAKVDLLNAEGNLIKSAKGFDGKNATDENEKSYTRASSRNPWILQIDVGALRKINKLSIEFHENDIPEIYKVSITSNGTDWTDILTNEENKQTNEIKVDDIITRYIRIELMKGSMGIAEVTVYADDFIVEAEKNTSQDIKIVTFKDIANHWAKEDIEFMASRQIVKGFDANRFLPEQNITRSEFIVMAMRAANIQKSIYSGVYTDIESKMWYADYIQGAIENDIMDSAMITNNCFEPEKILTREEMASILAKLYKDTQKDVNDQEIFELFADKNKISEWAEDYVKIAVSQGLMIGESDTLFNPDGPVVRAQATVALRRVYK